ncbi:MAG: EAL domain-containing protein [Lachnospiraceae bacterium]|nr:EAL domain-containing protein [Lachnospiraceae bacterium]
MRGTAESLRKIFCLKGNQIMDDIASACQIYYRCYSYQGDHFKCEYNQNQDISPEEREALDFFYPEEMIEGFLERFPGSDLENVIRGQAESPRLMSGIAVRDPKKGLVFVIILLGLDRLAGDPALTGKAVRLADVMEIERCERLIESSLDLCLSAISETGSICQELTDAREESERNRILLERNASVNQMLNLMEGENDFHKAADQIIGLAAKTLHLSEAAIFQEDQKDNITIVSEYAEKKSMRDDIRSTDRADFPFFNGRSYTISSDSMLPENFRAYFELCGIRAAVFYPIIIDKKPELYLQFASDEPHFWKQDEIQYLNEVRQVCQTILIRKITTHSLAGSYKTLNAILEHTGCGVEVIDPARNNVLYTNKAFQAALSDEGDRRALEEELFRPMEETGQNYTFEAKRSRKWYEVSLSEIHWVDGRRVRLVTIYDVTGMKHYQERIEHQIYTDSLTGLKNRKCCESELQKELDRSVLENGSGGAYICVDLDDFKNINDSLGHKDGDLLLQKAAEDLVRTVGSEAVVYRTGGDEFGIMIPEYSHRSVEQISEQVLQEFKKPWILRNKKYYCTCSLGIARYPKDGHDLTTILRHADMALQRAKTEGKGCCRLYTEDGAVRGVHRLDLEKALREAVEGGCSEFEVYYQPLVDITKEGHPCSGAEALVRWKSKELGFVMPGDFISLSEYLGLIVPIGKHVLFEACRTCRHWNDFGHPDYRVNVNLSMVQIVQKDIVDTIREALEDSGLNPYNLVLEVTEGIAIHDFKNVIEVLDRIKELGVRVALDDFGTGYSSLNCLKELPLDAIKIDKTFIDHIGEDDYSDAFVKTVSNLANVMQAKVVVEGVETEKQTHALKDMHVNFIQGYYYDKPMPMKDFEEKYL